VGDRCFDEGNYEAARVLFAFIPNYGRLASTLVRLHRCARAGLRVGQGVCPVACIEFRHIAVATLSSTHIHTLFHSHTL